MRELTNQYDATITKQWRNKYQTKKSQADIQQKRGKPYTYMSVTVLLMALQTCVTLFIL